MTEVVAAPVVPGVVSPIRPVPESIPRPEYVGRKGPARYTGPEVKDADTIEWMRVAGRLAAQAMVEVSKGIEPGVVVERVELLDKTGGKSDFHREPAEATP